MKTPSAKRALEQGQIKHYVMGWCVEVDAGSWKDTLNKRGTDICRPGAIDPSGIWSRENAVKLARKQQASASGWKWYAREMIYSTPNPKNARGMREVGINYIPEVAS